MSEQNEALRLIVAYCETTYIEPKSDLWEALIVLRRMIAAPATVTSPAALTDALYAAANYIDALGGDSKKTRALLAAQPAADASADRHGVALSEADIEHYFPGQKVEVFTGDPRIGRQWVPGVVVEDKPYPKGKTGGAYVDAAGTRGWFATASIRCVVDAEIHEAATKAGGVYSFSQREWQFTDADLIRFATTLSRASSSRAEVERDAAQLSQWLLTDPETGERLRFAGPLERDFLGLSRVRMESASGAVWTLIAGIKEGYLTASERMENIRLAAAEVPNGEPISLTACKGMNCGCTDGASHSLECQAEHAAAIAGGSFVKNAKSRRQAITDALIEHEAGVFGHYNGEMGRWEFDEYQLLEFARSVISIATMPAESPKEEDKDA